MKTFKTSKQEDQKQQNETITCKHKQQKMVKLLTFKEIRLAEKELKKVAERMVNMKVI